MTAINVPFSLGIGESLVIPVDRWGHPTFTLHLTSSGSGTIAVAGTLQRLNVGETPSYTTLDDWEGNALTAVADPAMVTLAAGAYEAIRLTAATATVTGTFAQSGTD